MSSRRLGNYCVRLLVFKMSLVQKTSLNMRRPHNVTRMIYRSAKPPWDVSKTSISRCTLGKLFLGKIDIF